MTKIVKYCFNTQAWSPNRQQFIHLLSGLPSEERERVIDFVFKRDIKQKLIGQLLIRYALQNLLHIDWNKIQLGRTAKGRPFMKIRETLNSMKVTSLNENFDFNISHAGDYAIVSAASLQKTQTTAPPATSSSFKLRKSNEKTAAAATATAAASSSTANINESNHTSNELRIGTDIMKIDVSRSARVRTSSMDSDSQLDQEPVESVYQQELNKFNEVIFFIKNKKIKKNKNFNSVIKNK
jgi:hypothetical protein